MLVVGCRIVVFLITSLIELDTQPILGITVRSFPFTDEKTEGQDHKGIM